MAATRRTLKRPSHFRRLVLLATFAFIAFASFTYWRLPIAEPLAKQNPKETALQRARVEEAARKGKKARRRQFWVNYEQVSPVLIAAVIASEDANFYAHHGVDWTELRISVNQSWAKRELGRGASTITQQLAKNLWLSTDRSLWRKAKEVVLAKRLETALNKRRILTLYLNVVEWGDGVYGIEAAAREHFGTSAAALTPAQAAVLASMLPAPRAWSAARKTPRLYGRSVRLLARLAQTGKVDAMKATFARNDLDAIFGKLELPPEEPDDAAMDEEGTEEPYEI